MARPRKTEAPDLAHAVDLTAGAIERLSCPTGKQQAFLRDSKAPGLRVRVTAAGAKAYVFEAKLNRQTIRRTIGDVRAWTIEQARAEANRLRVLLDSGHDPRELEREAAAAKEAAIAEAERQAAQRQAQAEREILRHMRLIGDVQERATRKAIALYLEVVRDYPTTPQAEQAP